MITGDLIRNGKNAFDGGGTSNTYFLPTEFTALDSDSTIEEILPLLGGDLEGEALIDSLNADKTATLCFQSISAFDNSYGSQKHIDTTTPINFVSDYTNISVAGFPSTKSLEISFIDPYYIPSERRIRIKTMKVSLKVTPSSVEGEPDTREWDYSYSELASFYHSGTIPQIARLPLTLLTLENGLTSEELQLFINPNNTLQDNVEAIVLTLNGSLATGTLTYPLVIFMSKDSQTIPFTYTSCTAVDWENRDPTNRPIPFYPCHLELEYTHENTHFRGVFDKETADSDWVYNVERTGIGDSTYIIPSNVLNLENSFTSEQIKIIFGSEQNILDMLSELNSGAKTPLIYANMGGTNRWCQYPHDVYSDGATYMSLLITSLGGLDEPTTRRYELRNTAGEWKATVTPIKQSSVSPSGSYILPNTILTLDSSMTSQEIVTAFGSETAITTLISDLDSLESLPMFSQNIGESNIRVKVVESYTDVSTSSLSLLYSRYGSVNPEMELVYLSKNSSEWSVSKTVYEVPRAEDRINFEVLSPLYLNAPEGEGSASSIGITPVSLLPLSILIQSSENNMFVFKQDSKNIYVNTSMESTPSTKISLNWLEGGRYVSMDFVNTEGEWNYSKTSVAPPSVESITLTQLNSFLTTSNYLFELLETDLDYLTYNIPLGKYYVEIKTNKEKTKSFQLLINQETGLSYKRNYEGIEIGFISNIVEVNETKSQYGTTEFNPSTGMNETTFNNEEAPWVITGTPESHWKPISTSSSATPGVNSDNPKVFQYKGKLVPTEGIIYMLDPMNPDIAYVSGTTPTFSASNVIIADTYEGSPVVRIGSNAFSYKLNIESVSLPDSVTTIEMNAFNGTSISTINLDKVTSIGDSAFSNCLELRSVSIPSTMEVIESLAFSNNFELNIYVDIYEADAPAGFSPQWYYSIGSVTWKAVPLNFVLSDDGTYYSVDLNQAYLGPIVTIPEIHEGLTVKGIVDNAFLNNAFITEIHIPSTIEYMGVDCFSGTTSVGSIYVDLYERPTYWDSTWVNESQLLIVKWNEIFTFQHCSTLSVNEGYAAIGYAITGIVPDYTGSNIIIPEYYEGELITVLKQAAFRDNANIVNVTMGENITYIGHTVFANCSNLVSVTLPNNITELRRGLFEDCRSLSEIQLPPSLLHIRESAFDRTGLISIEIPQHVISIGYANDEYDIENSRSAFSECIDLTEVSLPESLRYLGYNAFMDCIKLTTINIPTTMTYMPKGMFYRCNSLESIDISSVDSLDNDVFFGCIGLRSIRIPNGVTIIPDNCFYSCTNLTSIAVHDGVSTIASHAFNGAQGIEPIVVYTNYTKDNYPSGWVIEGEEPAVGNAPFFNAEWRPLSEFV